MEGKNVCIVTGEEVDRGYPVLEDSVIRLIRKIKAKLGTAKNNKLFVSEDHYEEYKKRRAEFEKRVMYGSIFVAVIFLVGILAPAFSGDFQRAVLMVGPVVILTLLVAVLLLFSYVPRIGDEVVVLKPEQRKTRTKQRGRSKASASEKRRAKR